MKSRFVAGTVLILLFAAATLVAHHSNAAQFDSTKRITLKGEITKVEWTNPHAYIYIAVKDTAGKVTTYSLEGFPPNTLLRTGWSQKDLKQGDMITVEGCVARDGSPILLAREVTLADGATKKWWGPMS
jgi:Family of unknown function (DUF6152)